MEPEAAKQSAKSAARIAAISLATAAIAAVIGFAAVYVTLGRPDNVASPPPPAKTAAPSPPAAAPAEAPKGGSTNPLSAGHMAAFVFRDQPAPLPEIKLQDAEGKERTLADWRGKVVLLNLWATWCLPCRKEMPSLDRLQAALGSDKFEVVALSVDRKGLEASKKFLDEIKVEHLGLYVDPTARTNTMLRAIGLPATILIDAQGREVGRLLGPAEWDSEDAQRLIRAVVG
ncbi:MAG TPA: TlpA disulfide reductase family protein [Hyphomicrobiaceae bacterium]|nr:TlpA disulfide reductase family protein [Hyphomicrobiaceae bacterium]